MERVPDIAPFKKRSEEINALMLLPDFYSDQRKAAAIGREHQKLNELINGYDALVAVEKELEESHNILADNDADEEMKALAREELSALEAKLVTLREKVLIEMLPPDESDSRNTVVEIRAGAGGDEASLFGGDLYRMYCRFAEMRRWKVEALSSSTSECGGFKEISFLVSGEDVYKTLKFESGVHRVQRVPTTEANGRIHTSTATVAVLPEAEEVDIHIDPSELEITICRASGPGGQGVNTTDSAVQIIHKPTGVTVNCADERSQLKNKLKAMTILRSRLLQKKEEEERAKYAADRKSQIGSGDRSERIRTYNFPQSRLTDHRIGFSSHNLPGIMEGGISDLIEALQRADYESRVNELLNAGSKK
jgi:peptide chain release factor 1